MITKEAASALIERLADYEDEWEPSNDGCGCKWPDVFGKNTQPLSCEYHSHIQQPIMLTDVLEKMQSQDLYHRKVQVDGIPVFSGDHIVDLWADLGFTKSLQDILSEAEWECGICNGTRKLDDVANWDDEPHLRQEPSECTYCKDAGLQVMKGPAADLFAYLITL